VGKKRRIGEKHVRGRRMRNREEVGGRKERREVKEKGEGGRR